MYDRATESVWLQIGGRAIKGPLLGTVLKTGPLLDTTWGRWKALHPDTLVLSPDTPYRRYYGPKDRHMERGSPNGFPAPYFRASLTRTDKRLPSFEMVLAVALPQPVTGEAAGADANAAPAVLYRAYPVKALQESPGVLNDTLGGTPIGVLFDPKTTTATAVRRSLEGKTLTLEAHKQPDGTIAYFDKETGTRWNIEGKGEAGPLEGRSLERVDSHLSEWYGWVAYFPETSIFGRNDPPQTENLTPSAVPSGP